MNLERHAIAQSQIITPLQPAMWKQVSYQEKLIKWNPFSLKNFALCYEFRTEKTPQPLELLPDACLDFLFRLDPEHPVAVVRGIQTERITLSLEPNAVYFGFKPYSCKGMKNTICSWRELQEQETPLEDLLPCQEVLEQLIGVKTFGQRVETIESYAKAHLADDSYTPDFVEHSELKLCGTRGKFRVEEMANYTGYTSRYCREKFKEAHGISMKRYAGILRAQNAIRMMAGEEKPDLADVVFENGYFDQSHFSREFRSYTGCTPLSYQRAYL